jgi:glycosyltransferase involved in cell wall biosynthesis
MRILYIIPSLAQRDGGPSKAAIDMCRDLRRRGEDAEVYTTNVDGNYCLDVPLATPIDINGARVTYFPVNGGHYYKFSISMAAALKANVHHYDIVHINSLYQFPSTAAAHYCRKYSVPYILRPHGTLDPYLYRRHPLRKRIYELLVERRNLVNAAVVHFTADEEMSLAHSLGLRFQGVVMPLGVEVNEVMSACNDVDPQWSELAEKRVILFLGRINFKKGLDLLAEAFGTVHQYHPDAHLVIAGPDSRGYVNQVRRWFDRAGALDAVTFADMVADGPKVALFKCAEMFVLSSYSENFGIAVVEAMAAGLPVIISNKVNIWREVVDAGAGLVVNPEAPEVARAILKLLEEPALGKKMGERGRLLVQERFVWDVVGDRLIDLYHQIIAHSSGMEQ